MTKLFQEAITKVSIELDPQDQDRFAQLIFANVGKLHDLVDDLIEEYTFENQVITAIESAPIQELFKQVAEKHHAQYTA
jgi:hypothetical protein